MAAMVVSGFWLRARLEVEDSTRSSAKLGDGVIVSFLGIARIGAELGDFSSSLLLVGDEMVSKSCLRTAEPHRWDYHRLSSSTTTSMRSGDDMLAA